MTWDPDLNEDGTKALRTDKVWGKEAQDDGAAWVWPTNALHRSFKVTVEMPQFCRKPLVKPYPWFGLLSVRRSRATQ